MTEKQIESDILTWLNLQKGVFAFKVNTVGVYDPTRKVFRKNKNPFLIPGTSDIIGSCLGIFMAIEVKTPQAYKRFMNRPNDKDQLQKSFLEAVARSGGVSLVTCALDGVIEWFKSLQDHQTGHRPLP